MNSTSWAPPGESASDLWLEKSNFHGGTLSFIAYGVHLTLYGTVLQHLVHNARGSRGKRANYYLIAYITWNFILGTLGIATEARFNEMTFIDDRNYPGGPNAFVFAQYGDFINIFGTACYIVLNWFADGLVLSRLWLIYGFDYRVAAFPTAMLLGSVAMGCILLFQLTQPNANLWTVTTVNFGIPYWSISASLNILVTLLIVGRLMWVRRATRRVLADNHARTYTSVAAMVTESAALYSITALVFIITYARNSDVQNLFLPVLGQVQAVSPLLIMWRVARGQAWTRETVTTASKISWATPRTRSHRTTTNQFGTTFSTSKDTGDTISGTSPPSTPIPHKDTNSTVSHIITFDEPVIVGGVRSPDYELELRYGVMGKEERLERGMGCAE